MGMREIYRWFAVVLVLTVAGCQTPPVADPVLDTLPLKSAITWQNWSENLVHKPARSGEYYYFVPTSRDELTTIVGQAEQAGVQLRVSGQRHTQAPLVADDNRNNPPYRASTWLVDLSCYADLGADGDQQIVVDAQNQKVKVNTGVREDFLDAVLGMNNLMLKTATAGGFFSLGGMTAIDVHGATLGQPIFAETVSAFDIMGADGTVTTIDASNPAINFARVSLGALGIVTSVTLDVNARPYADTLQSGRKSYKLTNVEEFVATFMQLKEHGRLEVFYNPYSNVFDVLWWNTVTQPPGQEPNKQTNDVPSACVYAQKDAYGSPYEPKWIEKAAQWAEPRIQLSKKRWEAEAAVAIATLEVNKMFDTAQQHHEELWLTQAARAIFMSYFVEVGAIDEAGLTRVWQALQVVHDRLKSNHNFLLASPMEFRFIRGGDSALAGTYSPTGATFVNLDMIGFVAPVPGADYPPRMLDFFAAIEKEWYGTFGGMPHNGKMYGFHDPATGATTAPFSQPFLQSLAQRRGQRLENFANFQRQRDPDGRFCNDFLRAAGACLPQ